jgi:hypothetical protein
MLSVQTRTFSPTFSPTRLIQTDPASSLLDDLAQPCACWTNVSVSGRVAMQEAVGSSPTIRFFSELNIPVNQGIEAPADASSRVVSPWILPDVAHPTFCFHPEALGWAVLARGGR